MDRLKIVLLLVISFASTTASNAHDDHEEHRPQTADHGFAVVGDVSNFNYFSLRGKTLPTIKEAVLNAGISTDTVMVSILRGTQERALWTQVISRNTADSGETVQAEDILVVKAMSQPYGDTHSNAAIRSDIGIIVVALADATVAIGDILLQTGQTIQPGDRISLLYRHPGSPSLKEPDLSSKVSHGDVISLQRKWTGNKSVRRMGNIVPAFSEWKGTSTPPLNIAHETTPFTSLHFAAEQTDSVSYSTDESKPQAIPQETTTLNPLEADPSTPAADQLPPIRPENEVARSHTHALRVVSQSSEVPGHLPATAPLPPIEESITPRDSEVFKRSEQKNYWNLAFIGIFVVASSLIIFGATRRESVDAHELRPRAGAGQGGDPAAVSSDATSIATKPTVDGPRIGTAKVEPEVRPNSERLGVSFPSSETLANAPGDNISTENLIATHERFSHDWMIRTSAQSVSDTSSEPGLPGGQSSNEESPGFAGKSPSYLLEELVTNSLAESSGPATTLLDGTKQTDGVVISPTNAPDCTQDFEETQKTAHRGSDSDSDSAELRQFELLLQNRLPLDLCTAELPLRISLFGRPAGPHRLRVDAAHSKVPAPHIRTGVRVKAASAEATVVSASDVPNDSSGDLQGLDQALNFLQDRNDV